MWTRIAPICGMLLFFSGASHSQSSPVIHHEANFDAERKQADELFTHGFHLQALPLYTDLSRQDPTIAVFAERHGSGLLAAADIESDLAKKQALNQQAMAEFQRAKSLGDNSPLVDTMLGMDSDFKRADAATKSNGISAATNSPGNLLGGNPEAQTLMREAEVAFAKNDNTTAFQKYKMASELDPNSYNAKLYAGDACFRGGDFTCAGEWFGKAIALDPNVETAYRYWGDALYKSGHSQEARDKYVQAIVANPYTRLSWNGLAQWGQVTKTSMSSPPIQRPAIGTAGQGTQVTMPQGSANDMGAWATYTACRITADHARPAGARRTADEETDCLEKTADYAEKEASSGKPDGGLLSPGLQALISLKHDGMIECWLLLNGADQEVLHDYAAFRDAHRDLLIAYVNKYVIHESAGAK